LLFDITAFKAKKRIRPNSSMNEPSYPRRQSTSNFGYPDEYKATCKNEVGTKSEHIARCLMKKKKLAVL
jgi:hypothetical protein